MNVFVLQKTSVANELTAKSQVKENHFIKFPFIMCTVDV